MTSEFHATCMTFGVRGRPYLAGCAVMAGCLLVCGCQTPLFPSQRSFNLLRAKTTDPAEKPSDERSSEAGQIKQAAWSSAGGSVNADREKTTFEKLTPWIRRTVSRSPAELAAAIEKGAQELDTAKQLKADGKLAEAEASFKQIAKTYKDTPAEEEALFLRAECLFESKKYPKAQDGYDELFQRFPGSRFTETSTRRLFHIAQIWMKEPVVVAGHDVQPVSFEERGVPQSEVTLPPPPSQPALLPNVFDRSRPVFDTEGRALQALKSIWLHDPVGALADDALMLTASYHLRKKQFVEADHALNLLREEYPKSPHLQDAFVLGSHVKLMTYQGAEYDDLALEKSEELKMSTLRLFPNSEHRQRLQDELRRIEDAKAARAWENLVFWRKKDRQAAAVYATLLIEEFPTSQYADKARDVLRDLSPDVRKALWRDETAAVPSEEATTPETNAPAVKQQSESKTAEPRRFFPDESEPVPEQPTVADEPVGRVQL